MKTLTIFTFTLFVLTNSLSQARSWKDNFNLRNKRKLLETNSIPCKSGSINSCECPGACMIPNNLTNQCNLKKCYGWDSNLGECHETGPKFIPAIVLQVIPFTGVFGSGFGNMGRWDLFGVSMGIFFGGCSFLLLGTCCAMVFSSSDETRHGFGQCISTYGGCIWGAVVLVYYIWGIVTIANKEVLGPDDCPLS